MCLEEIGLYAQNMIARNSRSIANNLGDLYDHFVNMIIFTLISFKRDILPIALVVGLVLVIMCNNEKR